MNGNKATSDDCEIELMPKIRNVTEAEKLALAIRKMDFCCRPTNTNAVVSNQSSSVKNSHKINPILSICVAFLEELIEYFGSTKEAICDRIYPALFEMVSNQIYGDEHLLDNDAQWRGTEKESFPNEENGDRMDRDSTATTNENNSMGWKQTKLIYDLFSLVIESNKFYVTQAKNFVDEPFARRLITNLANCSASEERHCLSRILRRIYAKFVRLRPHIRKHLNYSLLEAVFDERSQLASTKTFFGIAEILEVLENVISGFKVPLRRDDQQMLFKVLLPLHKMDSLEYFYKTLIDRIIQFIELDPALTPATIEVMLKWWPKTSGQREFIFLDELELILIRVEDQRVFSGLIDKLFTQLSKCVNSQHFQVSIKVLHFWKRERILKLIRQNSSQIIQIIFDSLVQTAKTHWSIKIQSEAKDVLNLLMEINWKEYSKKMAEMENCNL